MLAGIGVIIGHPMGLIHHSHASLPFIGLSGKLGTEPVSKGKSFKTQLKFFVMQGH